MSAKTLEELTTEEFEQLGHDFIERAAESDDALPAELFFATWAEIERRKRPAVVRIAIVDDHLELSAVADSWVRVQDNRIRLDDGREVVIELTPPLVHSLALSQP